MRGRPTRVFIESHERAHRVGPDWKGQSKGLAICLDCAVYFIGGEDHKPADDPKRSPTMPCGDLHRLAFVPTQLSFDRADVVETRLHFDDEQRAGSRLIRDEIDPAVRSRMDDLDLPASLPARPTEAPVDISGAAGMEEVALPRSADDDRPARKELEFDPEHFADPVDEIQRRVRAPDLDRADVRPGDPDRASEVPLRDVEHRPRLAAERREAHTDPTSHSQIEASSA